MEIVEVIGKLDMYSGPFNKFLLHSYQGIPDQHYLGLEIFMSRLTAYMFSS
jgi:hypothetical protein